MSIEMNQLLLEMVQQGGSDLLVAAGYPVTMRKYGSLVAMSEALLTQPEVESCLQQVLSETELETLRTQQDMDFAYQVEHPTRGFCRFRANAFYQRFGPSIRAPRRDALPTPSECGRSLLRISRRANGGAPWQKVRRRWPAAA